MAAEITGVGGGMAREYYNHIAVWNEPTFFHKNFHSKTNSEVIIGIDKLLT